MTDLYENLTNRERLITLSIKTKAIKDWSAIVTHPLGRRQIEKGHNNDI